MKSFYILLFSILSFNLLNTQVTVPSSQNDNQVAQFNGDPRFDGIYNYKISTSNNYTAIIFEESIYQTSFNRVQLKFYFNNTIIGSPIIINPASHPNVYFYNDHKTAVIIYQGIGTPGPDQPLFYELYSYDAVSGTYIQCQGPTIFGYGNNPTMDIHDYTIASPNPCVGVFGYHHSSGEIRVKTFKINNFSGNCAQIVFDTPLYKILAYNTSGELYDLAIDMRGQVTCAYVTLGGNSLFVTTTERNSFLIPSTFISTLVRAPKVYTSPNSSLLTRPRVCVPNRSMRNIGNVNPYNIVVTFSDYDPINNGYEIRTLCWDNPTRTWKDFSITDRFRAQTDFYYPSCDFTFDPISLKPRISYIWAGVVHSNSGIDFDGILSADIDPFTYLPVMIGNSSTQFQEINKPDQLNFFHCADIRPEIKANRMSVANNNFIANTTVLFGSHTTFAGRTGALYNKTKSKITPSFFTSSIDETASKFTNNIDVTYYPNPTTEYTTLKIDNSIGEMELEIFDINGKHILKYNSVKNNQRIDMSNWSNGTYLFVVNHDNQKYKSLIIKR